MRVAAASLTLFACAHATSPFIGEVLLDDSPKCNWCEGKPEPMTAEGKQLAHDAVRAFLIRMAGHGPKVREGRFFSETHRLVYMFLPFDVEIPSELQRVQRGHDMQEVLRHAELQDDDVGYFKVEVEGLTRRPDGTLVVTISYTWDLACAGTHAFKTTPTSCGNFGHATKHIFTSSTAT